MVIGVFSTLSFVVEISLGLVLTSVFSGIPLIGGLLSALPDAAIVFLGAYLVPRRGGILLFAVILLTFSTVTPSFGPAGAYKILIGIMLGLTCELILMMFGRKVWVYILATAVAFSASIPFTYWAWEWFGLPGVEDIRTAIPWLMVVYAFLGGIGAYGGFKLYSSRLSQIPALQRVREGSW